MLSVFTYLSLRSLLRPPYSMGGEAGLPCLSIQEHVCRYGNDPVVPRAAPGGSAVCCVSRGAIDAYMGSLEGGPKPCSGAVELSVGGDRTVILIWRCDFNICTHLCVKKKCGNRRDKKEEENKKKKVRKRTKRTKPKNGEHKTNKQKNHIIIAEKEEIVTGSEREREESERNKKDNKSSKEIPKRRKSREENLKQNRCRFSFVGVKV